MTVTATNPVRVRPARSSDLSSLADIVNHEIQTGTASWSETPRSQEYMARWIVDRTGAGYPVYIAEEDRVLGVAGYGPFRKGEGYRFTVEHSIYVTPEARGRGIAKQLLHRLIEHAREDGLHRMVAAISGDQDRSIGLHKHMGFREVGRLPEIGFKFDRWLDLVFMVRDL
ncbi:MAG: N-acetyltransferase family protein [Pseudomonadota bacterium]